MSAFPSPGMPCDPVIGIADARIAHRRRALERSSLLHGLPAFVLERMARHLSECRLREGGTLFFKDDPGDCLELVVDGQIYKLLYGPGGQELIVGAVAPGEFVDEAVLLGPHERSFTAVAYAETTVLKLSRRHLAALASEPIVLERANAALCASLRQAIGNLENMCLHRLESRLARYLLLQLRPGQMRGEAAIEIVLPPTQSILAAMVNVSRSKLNEQLQRWHRSGLVSRRRNVLRINDLAEFRCRAYLQPALPPPGSERRAGC